MEIYGEISMEFHGTWCPNPSWNSMENFPWKSLEWGFSHGDTLVLTRYSRFAKMHEKAAVTGLLFTIFFLGLIRKAATSDQCNGPRQIPIQGKMLKEHIYETRWVRSGYAECLFICREEKVCQSFNFVVKESMCEFNNRTKEACSPEDFVPDRHRLYVKLDVSRGKELWNCFKRFTTAC